MRNDEVPPRADTESGYAWFGEGSMPHSREDRVAEALALIALLFSVSIGLLIAMLPTSAQADATSIGRAAWNMGQPARTGQPRHLVAAVKANVDDRSNAGRCIEGGSPRPCIIRR